jgi:hypothetical protein
MPITPKACAQFEISGIPHAKSSWAWEAVLAQKSAMSATSWRGSGGDDGHVRVRLIGRTQSGGALPSSDWGELAPCVGAAQVTRVALALKMGIDWAICDWGASST